MRFLHLYQIPAGNGGTDFGNHYNNCVGTCRAGSLFFSIWLFAALPRHSRPHRQSCWPVESRQAVGNAGEQFQTFAVVASEFGCRSGASDLVEAAETGLGAGGADCRMGAPGCRGQ